MGCPALECYESAPLFEVVKGRARRGSCAVINLTRTRVTEVGRGFFLSTEKAAQRYREGTENKCAGRYKYGFNGKLKDNEIAGVGNSYDYGFRMYNPRLGRFTSVDPLTHKFPMLTPYQFASNTPIWAMDQDGREALIINSATKTTTFVANVYYVTKGPAGVSNTTALKREVASQILANLQSANRDAKELNPGVYTIDIKLNNVTTDADGKPLTMESARALAANSTVNYTDQTGQPQTLTSWKTGVVVKDDQGELNEGTYAQYTMDGKNQQNTITVRDKAFGVQEVWDMAREFVHELGHFLGVDGHPTGVSNTDPGVTSRDHRNIELKGTDVLPMLQGGGAKGEKVRGTP